MAPSAARSAGCARLLVRLLCASWASLAGSLVIVEPLRTAGNLQCLVENVLPFDESYYNPDEDGCATECASVGPGVCIWFAQTKASESSYLCLFYGTPRTAPTVDCPHNHTLFASDSTYVVWERHEIVSNTSMESPVGCECVCAEVERIGDVSCDETIGALSGCYAHRGVFNDHLLYRQQGQDQSIWMFHSSDTAGKGGWRFDSHPAPGHFDARVASAPHSGLPLGKKTWEIQCHADDHHEEGEEEGEHGTHSHETHQTSFSLTCQECSPAPPAQPIPDVPSCALLDEVEYVAGYHVDQVTFYRKSELGGGSLTAGTFLGGEAHTPLILEPNEFIESVYGKKGCGALACWLVITTSSGRSIGIGRSYEAGNRLSDFTLSPDTGYGVLGLTTESATGLALVQRACNAVDPPWPPTGPPPPSPPPHSATNLLTLNTWLLNDGGGDLSWKFGSYGGFSYLRTSRVLCIATQTVDLREPQPGYRGYSALELLSHRLNIRVSVTVQAYDGYWGFGATLEDYYYVHFEVQNKHRDTLATWSEGREDSLLPITPASRKRRVKHIFTQTDDSGFRTQGPERSPLDEMASFVVVRFGGRSAETWDGAYGAQFTSWSVELFAQQPPSPPAPPSPQPIAPPAMPPPNMPSPPSWPPLVSCALVKELQFHVGYFVDSITVVPLDSNTTVMVGYMGGWPVAPLVFEPGEFIQFVRGKSGCGFLACWMEFVTSSGRTRAIGLPPSGEPSYVLRVAYGHGFAGLSLDQGTNIKLMELPCDLSPQLPPPSRPPSPPPAPPMPPPAPPTPPHPPVPPPVSPAICADNCLFASDGDCDDGGAGSEYSSCLLGMDCTDCGARPFHLRTPPLPPSPTPPPSPPKPPPAPPTVPGACFNDCFHASDGDCDDGGLGAEYSICEYSEDCADCGVRPFLSPPSPPKPPFPPSPPSSPPNPPLAPQKCENSCRFSSDSYCDDGGLGAHFEWCDFGTDCIDCSPRILGSAVHLPALPPPGIHLYYRPPAPSPPPSAPSLCDDTCFHYASDGDCDDGGPGSHLDHCLLGTDCTDCGSRPIPHPPSPRAPASPHSLPANPSMPGQSLGISSDGSGSSSVGMLIVMLVLAVAVICSCIWLALTIRKRSKRKASKPDRVQLNSLYYGSSTRSVDSDQFPAEVSSVPSFAEQNLKHVREDEALRL